MGIKIREAKIDDLPEILEIINYEILNSTSIFDYKERTKKQQTDWFNTKKREGIVILVAEGASGVIGFATFGVFRPWEGYKHSAEHSIYIHQNARRCGVGKLLLKELIIRAKSNGFTTLIAGIDSLNTVSIEFHKTFGFIEVGKLKCVGFKFNKWLDLSLLQLNLRNI